VGELPSSDLDDFDRLDASPARPRNSAAPAGHGMISPRADDQPLLRNRDSDAFKEHGVLHFHARYGGQVAVFTGKSFKRLCAAPARRAAGPRVG
jgi:hypothetical protein